MTVFEANTLILYYLPEYQRVVLVVLCVSVSGTATCGHQTALSMIDDDTEQLEKWSVIPSFDTCICFTSF
jgi:hypothetical protein